MSLYSNRESRDQLANVPLGNVHQHARWLCPECGQNVTEGNAELVCENGHRYPIKEGIPRFVANDQYATSFGIQWNLFEKTQLDSYTGFPLTRDRLRRCLGDDLFQGLKGKEVLEAGCGAGRFTEVLLGKGAVVTSTDLSIAVEANARNFPLSDTHHIAQTDLMKMPVPRLHYDAVVCLGVLQHTPDPEKSIHALYEHVKPGGWLIIDHYTHERRWGNLKPLYRAWLKRQPQERVMGLLEKMVNVFLPWHRALRNFYPAWFLLCRISPLTTFYRFLPDLPHNLQREFSLLDTHDSLTDWYKHIRSRDQIAKTLVSLGALNVTCTEAGNGIEGRCQRPSQ